MRIGQNPAKSIDHVPRPARVTIAVVNYAPFLSGYYAQSLEVLKACLGSIWQNTPQRDADGDSATYDLMVFDNASCPEVRQYLLDAHKQGRIQYLILSDRNLGKGGAWNTIFQGAPGEVIVYTDSDVHFSPGWLEHSLQVLDTFPNVGMVTALPLRTPEKYYTSTLEWAQSTPDARLENGQFLSWEIFKQHTDSVGVSIEKSREWFQESIDWRIQYQDVCAYVGAAHFQFTAPKGALQSVLPFKMDRPMGQVRSLDQKLNDAGYLRLTTCEPFVKHMGNRLDPAHEKITASGSRILRMWLANSPPIRRSLLWIYDRIFRLYFEGVE